MIGTEYKIPLYAKTILFLIGLLAFFTILYIGRSIFVPIVFSVIIAIVLHPVVNFLVRFRINRIIAIIITMIFTFIILAAFCFMLISQASRFIESFPTLVDKFTLLIDDNIRDASQYFEVNPERIHEWIAKAKTEIINSSSAAIGQTIKIIGNGLVVIFLLPVYIFLLLYYHPLLIDFIHKIFIKNDQSQLDRIISQIKTVIQRYLVGLIIEVIIVASLDTTALLIIGIEYAIIIGIIGAMLNMIPYIGGIVAVGIPMIVALVTKSSPVYALYVLFAYYIIQLIDNNYIVPKIVASKVKINALFSIIVVIAGNALWGIPGMFISIPLLAIVKVICDNIEPLKPWGFLLGDTMPPILKIKPIRFKKIRK